VLVPVSDPGVEVAVNKLMDFPPVALEPLGTTKLTLAEAFPPVAVGAVIVWGTVVA
jgi:hypothetical protein